MLKEYPDYLSSDDTQEEFQKADANLLMGNKENAKEIIHKDLKSIFKMEDLKEHTEHGESDSMKQYILDCSEKAEKLRMMKIEKDESSEKNRLPICEISLDDYVKYGDYFPKSAYFDSNTVYLPTMPYSCLHEDIISAINRFFLIKLFKDQIRLHGQPSCRIYEGLERRPDCSFIPQDKVDRIAFPVKNGEGPYPNIVIEVAYMNEDYSGLMQETMDWINSYTDVQIAIGLKIVRDESGDILTLFYAEKGCQSPTQFEIGVIDQDKKKINRAFLPKIELPTELVYHSATIPKKYQNKKTIPFDLRKFSKCMLECLEEVDVRRRAAKKRQV